MDLDWSWDLILETLSRASLIFLMLKVKMDPSLPERKVMELCSSWLSFLSIVLDINRPKLAPIEFLDILFAVIDYDNRRLRAIYSSGV